MALTPEVPQSLTKLVRKVGEPVSSADIDVYGRLQDIENERYRIRTVLSAWKQQQTQDRSMRRSYANWLMIAMGGQMVVINVIFVLIGCGVLSFEAWTAKTFIMAVFGEIAALVLLVVKYLFAKPDDTILKLIDVKSRTKSK